MKLSIISCEPEILDLCDIHLIIPEQLQYDDIVDYFRRTNVYKILDNGAYEGNQLSIDELLDWAKELRVHEVVAPEVFQDYDGSLKLLREFRSVCPKNLKIHYVYHSVLPELPLPGCDVIGIPTWMETEAFGRSALAHFLHTLIIHEDADIEIHLLGLNDLEDTIRCKPYVRSVDTSLPVTLGHHGYDVLEYTKDETQLSRAPWKKPNNWELVIRNCKTLKRLLE